MKKVEMTKMGDSMEESKILRWIKKEGEPVKKVEMLAEVETDKVNIEIEAFASGILRKIIVPEGTAAPVGSKIALIGASDEPLPGNLGENGAGVQTSANSEPQVKDVPSQVPVGVNALSSSGITTSGTQGRIFISPLARRMTAHTHVAYATLQRTAPTGRHIYMTV